MSVIGYFIITNANYVKRYTMAYEFRKNDRESPDGQFKKHFVTTQKYTKQFFHESSSICVLQFRERWPNTLDDDTHFCALSRNSNEAIDTSTFFEMVIKF